MSQSVSANASTEAMDKRTRKARNEEMHVDGVDATGTHGVVTVRNEDGSGDGPSENAVMVSPHTGAPTGCSCEDKAYNDPDDGCKHERFVGTLLKVVGSLREDDYVEEAEVVGMVDAPDAEVARTLHLLREME